MSVANRILGLIPARGGSKSIPQKNTQLLAGRPLLAYAADAARESGVLDRVVLSTDSEELADLGRRLGLDVPFLRPADLATDSSPMLPVMQHAVRALEAEGWRPDLVVLLQPTAPFRQGRHISDAVRLLLETGCDSVVSVVPVPERYRPHFLMKIDNGRLTSFMPNGLSITRRQDAPEAYSRDGSVYVTRRDVLMEGNSVYGANCLPLVLDDLASVNLDSPHDWELAERKLSSRPSR